jgi:glycosyltransferase involved in cell wall biosynthesis
MAAVTVIIPTRNRSEFLRLTLGSVLCQRDVDLSVVIVDDASTDDTADVVSRLADPRIRIVRQSTSNGVGAARNRGIAQATTKWVAFLDDDDLWSPQKLARQLSAAESLGRTWAYAGAVFVNADLRVQGGIPPIAPEEMRAALHRYNAVPAGASNVIVRVDVLERIGMFDAALPLVSDWDMWLRLARHDLPACVHEPLVGYRIHAGNASFRVAEILAELTRFERQSGVSTSRVSYHRHVAHFSLRSGRRAEALKHFGRALLCVSDGYTRDGLRTDGRLLLEHAVEILHRRLGPVAAGLRTRYLSAARSHDLHAEWKAQAQVWLDEVPGAALSSD